MSKRHLSGKNSKSSKRRGLFKQYFPEIEQLEIRWLPSITSAFQRTIDLVQTTTVPLGIVAVDPNTGSQRVSVPLDFDVSPGTSVGRNPALVYDSSTVAPRPIIEATLATVAGSGLPTQIQAQLTFNGTTQSWVTFSTSGHSAGDTYTIDTQAATAVTSTGAYAWSLSIKTYYSGSTVTDTASGTAYAVVHNLENEVGFGWSYASIDSLVPISGGIMYVSGGGGFRIFTGSSGTYTNPPNDFGTLVKNLGGTYTYTAKDQTVYNFNTSGLLTSVVDTHGQRVTYGYDVNNGLISVNTPDFVGGGGSPTGLSYTQTGSGDPLVQINQATSVLNVSPDTLGNLTAITDAAGHLLTFSYDGNHNMTLLQESPVNTTFAYDGTTGLLSSVSQGGNLTALKPAASFGLATSPAVGSPASATVTDPLSHKTTYTLDALGRTTNIMNPDGTTMAYGLDSAGHATSATDALSRVTTYSYGTGANADDVTQTTFADGSTAAYQYDSTFQKVTQYTDQLGHITTYALDSAGDVTSVKDAMGDVTTMLYSSSGQMTSMTDPDGHLTTYMYDSSMRLTTTVDALNERTTTTYDTTGNVHTVTDPLNRVTTTSYDANNRLTSSVDALGETTSFAYTATGLLTQTQLPSGVVLVETYDALGDETSSYYTISGTRQAVGGVTMAYDASGHLTASTDSNNHITTFAYDTFGHKTSMQDARGGLTTYGYDADGELTSVGDPMNLLTTYLYDSRGRVTSTIDAASERTTTLYDVAGNVTTSIDALNHRTTTTYDLANRATQVQNALGGLTTAVYDAAGNILAAVNALGARISYAYDALNRKTAVTDSNNHITTMTLDGAGNVTTVKDAAGDLTTYGFDKLNRQTSVQDADGGIATTVYDISGNVTKTVNQLNKVTTYAYDSFNRLTSTIDANNGTVAQTYDANGNRLTLTDQDNNTTTFVYDAKNNLTSQTDPLGHTGTMAYDADNRLSSKTDAVGNVISYSYDGANRELGETWKVSGTTTNIQTFTYDANGNQLTATDANGAYTMSYDALNRVTVTKEPFGVTLTATYDAIGERTQMQDSFGGTTTYVYDSVGNLTSEKFGGSGLTPLRIDQAYDPRNLVTTITRYSDLAGTTKIGSTIDAYDPAGRLTHQQDMNGSSANIANYTYAYDAAGQVTSEKLNGAGPTTYTYDNIGQLTNDGTNAYTYDAAGNRTMSGYTTGTGNQITGAGAWSYGYDLNGNMTTKTQGPSFNTWNYQFDAQNRLTSVQDRSTSGGTLLSAVTYVYDVKGNRIEEDTWVSGSGNTVTRFAYDGQNAFADLNSSNALVTRRLYENGVDALFARISAAGTAAWYLTDRLGSVRGMVDASGTSQATIAYDGFGNVTSNSNSSFTDRYLYTGRELDSVTGQQFNRARYYDPTIGRWTQRDPLQFAAGDANLYRYVHNSPLDDRDPSGLQPISYWWLWTRAIFPWPKDPYPPIIDDPNGPYQGYPPTGDVPYIIPLFPPINIDGKGNGLSGNPPPPPPPSTGPTIPVLPTDFGNPSIPPGPPLPDNSKMPPDLNPPYNGTGPENKGNPRGPDIPPEMTPPYYKKPP